MHQLRIVLTLLLIWLNVNLLQSQTRLEKDLNAYLEVIVAKKSFSGEVLVTKGEEVLFHRAIGLASVEDATPLKVGDTYRIASITKTFTGTLVAMAQEQGKLAFPDPIGKYIPNLTKRMGFLTIHQLLTHTSGLPHNEGITDYWAKKSKLEMSTDQMIAEINRLELLFEPGKEMKYSSPGYYLLGTLVEKVFDQSYRQALEEQILKPLGMTGSGATDSDQLVEAWHLLQEKRLPAPYRNYSMLKGAGDMYATAQDLQKWSQSFFETKLLGEEGLKTVLNDELKYAYGWFADTDTPAKFYHGGGTWGYSSYLAMYPADQISITILTNVSSLPMKGIGADIEKIVYGMPFTMPVLAEAVVLAAKDLEMYSGTYRSESSEMSLQIKRQGDALFAQIGGSPVFQIFPKGDHVFFGKKVEVEFTFQATGQAVGGVTAVRMGQKFIFKKR